MLLSIYISIYVSDILNDIFKFRKVKKFQSLEISIFLITDFCVMLQLSFEIEFSHVIEIGK